MTPDTSSASTWAPPTASSLTWRPGARPEEAASRLFDIPQLVDAGVVQARPLLPSFYSMPPEPGSRRVWPCPGTRPGLAVGEFASGAGQEVPDRLIAAAKSWLCNQPGRSRGRRSLPWSGRGGAMPPQGSFRRWRPRPLFSRTSAMAWNHAMATSDTGLDATLPSKSRSSSSRCRPRSTPWRASSP